MLAGRAQELAELTSLIGRPLERPGLLRVVQVDGPMGIGKSALLSAAIADISVPVLLSRGESTPGASPLSSQRSIIEALLKTPLEDALHEETIHTLASACAAAMSGSHTVLVVDDAQWLSPSAEEFLSALIQSPSAPPLTLVLSHRTGHTPSMLLAAARRCGAMHEQFTVTPLSHAAVEALLTDFLPSQASSVVAHAEGNPLFIQIAIAAFTRHPEALSLEEALQFENKTPSAILATAIADDIASIPPEAHETLETAAVLGNSWTVENGSVLFSGRRESYEHALALLEDHGLFGGQGNEIMHPVVRFSVYQHISAERRIELHRAAGHHPEADILTRAEHLAQLGSALTEAEAAVIISGAQIMLAMEPASTIRLLGSLVEPHRTYAVDILLARAEIMSGEIHDAMTRLRPLVVDGNGDPEPYILLADALRMTGNVEEARALLRAFPNPDNPVLLREFIEVTVLIEGHAPPRQIADLREYPEIEHQRVADIYDVIGMLATGDVIRARGYFESIPEWVRESEQGILRDCIHAIACAAWNACLLDDHEDALQIADRGIAVAQKYGRAGALPSLTTARAFCLIQLGRLAEAEDAALYALSCSETFGAPDLATMARAALLVCALPAGDEQVIVERYRELASADLPQFGWWRHAVVGIRVRASGLIGEPESYESLLSAPHDALTGMRYADIALAAVGGGEDVLAEQYIAQGLVLTRAQEATTQQALLYLVQGVIALKSEGVRELNVARALLEEAREIFASRKMGLQLGRADSLLAAVQEKLREANSPWRKLTPRERQVAEQFTQGLTNQQIATHLDISIRTVEDHAARILRKLEAPSRTRAAAILTQARAESG